MKSRLATIFTLLALVGGSGGALAVGSSGSHGGPHGGAAAGQYNSRTLKCKKGLHRVGNKCVKNGNKSKSGVRGQNNSRSRKGTGTTRRATGPSFTG